MASARNLCQHSDTDGTQCISNDYAHCPHCQLQLCLKHLNYHQDLLRAELHQLCTNIDGARVNVDHLVFDPTNQREHLFQKLDQWYDQALNSLQKTYAEKKQEIQILCWTSLMEFDVYKHKKEKQLKGNLTRQLNQVLRQKQIHVDELNEMRSKLDYIQRGLHELKQFNIDIHFNHTNFDINIIRRRYIEAAKPLFNDDDNNLWESNNEDEEEVLRPSADESFNSQQKSPQSLMIRLPSVSASTSFTSSTQTGKKTPLKLVIKRLQHPTILTEIKYKSHTVHTSVPIVT